MKKKYDMNTIDKSVHGGFGSNCGSNSPGNCFGFMLFLPTICPYVFFVFLIIYLVTQQVYGGRNGIKAAMFFLCVAFLSSCFYLNT